MHTELQEAIDLHEAIVAEAGNALVGYDTEKALANVVLLSEIPTTYDKDQKRQVDLDLKHLDRRRAAIAGELESEPAAIEALYEVRMARLTPVGLAVAWPESMT